ncbi:MAG: methylated-DNA--[protein]-cysteine S-methyltransferase [Actinobacteria bacterium]|nr:methylated-DNA--[protein]-cysteine S-methyltransferase [Actinomycetota bacterium]
MTIIRYENHSSPLGALTLAATRRGLCLIDFDASAEALERLPGRFDLQPGSVDGVAAGLDRYFAGRARSFDVALDFCLASPFTMRVMRAMAAVGFGQLTTYGRLAAEVGSSARAVGRAVGSNPLPIVIPCHRVIAADGTLGGYSSGLDRKRMLLGIEGHDDLRGGWPSKRRPLRPRPRRMGGEWRIPPTSDTHSAGRG